MAITFHEKRTAQGCFEMPKIALKFPDGKTKSLRIDGYVKEMLDGFHHAVHNHHTSAVIICDGKSGLGKSTLSNQLGLYLDRNFNLNKIHFTPESFLNGLAVAEKGSYICFDEAMLLSNRQTLSAINKMVVVAMSMIRSKNIFVSFCVNSIFDLDKNLAISRADVLYHLYGSHLYDRGKACAFFKSRTGEDRLKQLYLWGKKNYDYSRPKANFVFNFNKEFVVDEQKYEELKQKGVNEFLRRSEPRISRAEKDRNKLIHYLNTEHKMLPKEIAELISLETRAIQLILRKIRDSEESST